MFTIFDSSIAANVVFTQVATPYERELYQGKARWDSPRKATERKIFLDRLENLGVEYRSEWHGNDLVLAFDFKSESASL